MPTVSAAEVDYLRDIKPLLKSRCYSCHGALRQEGGLRLDTVALMVTGGDSGSAIARSGTPDDSLVFQRVSAADTSERMPPEGAPLSAEQQTKLAAWLIGGAPSPDNEQPQNDPAQHWAFQPVERESGSLQAHAVDDFIDEKLNDAGLRKSAPADPTSLVRRMFLDLHGLPPTPDQIDAWTSRIINSADSRPQVLRELIDDLLDSPRYGERWAQHWLDVVRYADTHGYEVNTPRPNAWHYRDYVIKAINDDRPYNQFVFDQIAGDTNGHDTATGFLVAAAALLPGQIGKDEASKRLARQDELDEIIVGTTATFLGLTVGCARCHDHKFDPILQDDYYALQAFFSGVRYGDRTIQSAASDRRRQQAEALQPEITALRKKLTRRQPKASTAQTIIIDDEDSARTTTLKQKNGHGANPAGTERGYRDDVGDAARFGNLSQGRYTWWSNSPGEDVFTWNPNAAGRFHIWISWGVHGSGVHTRDARYILDLDGDLESKADQQEIARADQYFFAGQSTGESEKKPLWSGLAFAGSHELNTSSRLVLRGGDTNTGITADVVVLQESSGPDHPEMPRLRGPVSAPGNTELFEPIDAKYVRFESFSTTNNDRYEPCIDELEVYTASSNPVNVALTTHGTVATSSGNYSTSGKHQLKHINDGNYGNSFSWISNQKGKGWVQLEFPEVQTIDHIEWGRDRKGQFKDRLPVEYQIEVSIDGSSWVTVSGSGDRVAPGTPYDILKTRRSPGAESDGVPENDLLASLKKLEERQKALREPVVAFAGVFQEPTATFVLNRGDPEQPTTEIGPRVPTNLGTLDLPPDLSDVDRRTALARWIVSETNPLTARVIVNRIWQHHFGVGLVDTPSDLGLNGSRPTHPELLDWLAAEFIQNNWSLKELHRTIMTSATYQQSSVLTAIEPFKAAMARDAANRLLWHFPRRRMEAEVIRDSMLYVNGQLNLEMGGPGFNFFKSRGGLSGFPPVEKFTSAELRRMIYAHKVRMERVPVFGAFDCPDAGLPAPSRSQSTTAIQALNLFNSPFVIEQAEAFTRRLQSELPDQPDQQIVRAFQLAVGRPPTPEERLEVMDVVTEHGMPTLCRVLYNSSEFLFLP